MLGFWASATGTHQQTAQDKVALEIAALQKELNAANEAFVETNREAAGEAEARYRRVLGNAEPRLQPDDPQLLCAKANLGVALRLQGKYAEAEEQFQQTLEICEEVCEARFVCQLKMNIAMSMKAQEDARVDEIMRRFAQAEKEADKLLKADLLKPDDYMLLTFKQSYGDFLLETNNLAGERMWLDVVRAKERTFGREDPRTLSCKQALAESLAAVQVGNKNNESLPVDEAGMRTKVAWHESPVPANRAAALMWEVLEDRQQVEENSEVIENTQVKLAEMLMNEVFPAELEYAENLLKDALARRVDRLGFEEKSVSDLHWILGACLWREGRHDLAAQEFKLCWQMREKLLGPDHEATKKAKDYYRRVRKRNRCCSLQ